MRDVKRKDLQSIAQGHRLGFIRRIRGIWQSDIGEALGFKGRMRYKWISKYETGLYEPKDNRLGKLTEILHVSRDAVRKYNFKNSSDLIYVLLWAEECCPNFEYVMDYMTIPQNDTQYRLMCFYEEWQKQKERYRSGEMTHDEYLEWKLQLKDL